MSPSTRARCDEKETTVARADRLFLEGQALLDRGETDAACKRLKESHTLDPKLGRLLNLAVCHEQQGKTATAYDEFREAASWAAQKGQKEREEFAHQHANDLSKRLSSITIDLPADAVIGSVAIDGVPLARERWPLSLPLDPGKHTLAVTATGKKPAERSFEVAGPGAIVVSAPLLEDAPMLAPPKATPLVADDRSHAWRSPGLASVSIGVGSLAVGTYFGLVALSRRNDADPYCPSKQCFTQGSGRLSDARRAATFSTVMFGVGALGIGVGAFLLLVSPPKASPERAAPRITPLIAPATFGLACSGAF